MAMSEVLIRPAELRDLPRLTEIYNHYVVNTPVTFDVEPYTVERREAWFAQFGATGRHRLLVAELGGSVIGYAGDDAISSEGRVRDNGGDHGLLRARGSGQGDWKQ